MLEYEEQPLKKYILIAYISSLLSVLINLEYNHPVSTQHIILSSLFGAVFVSLFMLFVSPYIFKFFGRLLGGEGHIQDIRVAVVYTQLMPFILVGFISLLFIFVLGDNYFYSDNMMEELDIQLSQSQTWSLSILGLLTLALSIWQYIIFLHGLAEAHKFSAWKSFLISIILSVVAAAIIFTLLIMI